MQSRRAFLVTGLAGASVALAGCNESSGGNGGNGGSSWETVADDTRQVPEDNYYAKAFELNRNATVQVDATVRQGPAIDIVTMPRSEFQEFEAGNRFQYGPSLSMLDSTGGQVSDSLESGQYVVLFDNTNRLEASPPTNLDDDIATVEFTIKAQ